MAQSRRQVLSFLGGSAAILAAAGGAGAFYLTRQPERARVPWETAANGQFDDPRLKALAYAVLAPNPHNKQPWLIDLTDDGGIDIYCELGRRLPQTDPFDRQITIGFGAFLELLRQAAAADGYEAVTTPFPDGVADDSLDQRRIARVRPEQGSSADPLFAHVLSRHTNRSPYAATPVTAEQARAIRGAARVPEQVGLVTAADEVAAIRDLGRRSWLVEILTPHTYQESLDVMRIGRAETNAAPDGISITGPMIEALRLAGVLNQRSLGDPDSSVFQQGIDMYNGAIEATPAFVTLVTPGNSRLEQLEVGRDWLRIQLAITALGLSMQPISQALQEFPEMAALYDEAHAMLAPAGGTVQMLARVGVGPRTPPAPRWPLETRLLSS